ncbi:MAG: class I SAM-dependent methyltransferase [Pikeienuella sp.]
MSSIDEWRGELGAEWAHRQAIMDIMLRPFGEAAMATLGDLQGKQVLDLGCGGGDTTFALAKAGAGATGLDVSADLVAMAQARQAENGVAASFICADAATTTHDQKFDALFSRFGAMFFDDQVAGYTNLRAAMKPGADLAIACWRVPKENEWAMLPLSLVRHLLPEPAPMPKFAPGPFAWSVPEETFEPALEDAGWTDLSWGPLDFTVELGKGLEDAYGGDPVEAATAFCMSIGPSASRLRNVDDDLRAKIEDIIRAGMAERLQNGKIMANAAGWVVTAKA